MSIAPKTVTQDDWEEIKKYAQILSDFAQDTTPTPFIGISALLLAGVTAAVASKEDEVDYAQLKSNSLKAVSALFDTMIEVVLTMKGERLDHPTN